MKFKGIKKAVERVHSDLNVNTDNAGFRLAIIYDLDNDVVETHFLSGENDDLITNDKTRIVCGKVKSTATMKDIKSLIAAGIYDNVPYIDLAAQVWNENKAQLANLIED